MPSTIEMSRERLRAVMGLEWGRVWYVYLPWALGRRMGKVGEREVGVLVRLLAR